MPRGDQKRQDVLLINPTYSSGLAFPGLRRVQSLRQQRAQQRQFFVQQQLPQPGQPDRLPDARARRQGAQQRGTSAAGLPQRARDGCALAGYMKYGRPHAWIRSNHERLASVRGADSVVRDRPVKLKSITDWQTGGIRVWDVVSELVSLCTVPLPSNPFALDMRYIQRLPVPERFLASGALLNFLETYAVCGNRDELHYDKVSLDRVAPPAVLEEVKPLRRLHVQTLLELQRLKKTPVDQDPPAEG
ncbi:uncharacterized protein si:dkey-19b23.7 isoform X4 [Syngnathoides biaculeatus]|uniref:uncharacterized protein si:dkey-19b23.7 isoform X4 n=1 Tax=Syngnathoides biaculeatus TaxID=300417 RepID=UPI002ADDAEC1|nr:uncharacterized protein si:dkey-19b23.7 isoform X4 [Syngnathoides biaculeatus]